MQKLVLIGISFVAGIATAAIFTALNSSPVLAQTAINVPAAIPTVPSLTGIHLHQATIANTGYQLDGFVCDDCSFENVKFTYGGGSFSLRNPKFKGGFSLTLVGAAANTVPVLALFKACAFPGPQPNQLQRNFGGQLVTVPNLISPPREQ